ncbi:hypothetical protein DKL94_000889 [Escherichia coli]|nr:hypothetical protein [Escherichia coli]
MNIVNNMSTVNQPELKQPEKAVSSEDIDNFIVDVFKETGHKISKDDPVISLIFLNQKIQKKFSNELQANFTALSEGFRQVVSSVENDYIQRFKNIVETCGDLDNEIKEKVEEGKNDLKETSVEVKEKLTDDIIELISGIKRNQEKNNKLYEEKLNSLSKAVKPFSTRTAIAICALCTLCLSAAFSGATWYVAQHEKEASLRFYARAFLDMKKITEESMRKLPKSDQQNIKLKLEEIDSRKP